MRKKARGILAFIIILVIIVGFFVLFKDSFKSTKKIGESEIAPHCVLSRCDCKCYFSGEEPDLDPHTICTNDCGAWKSIDHCGLVEGKCMPMMKGDSGALTRQIFFRGKRYVPTEEIQSESTFLEFSGERSMNSTDDNSRNYEIWLRVNDDKFIYLFKESYFEIWAQEDPEWQNQ